MHVDVCTMYVNVVLFAPEGVKESTNAQYQLICTCSTYKMALLCVLYIHVHSSGHPVRLGSS